MLRGGGYFVWAAQPVYKHEPILEEQWEGKLPESAFLMLSLSLRKRKHTQKKKEKKEKFLSVGSYGESFQYASPILILPLCFCTLLQQLLT